MYIRTKDGVYEVKKVEILCGVKFYDYETREDFVNRIREEQIINQSENLEELCDFILVWYGKMNEPVFVKYNSITYNALKENNRFKENKCYGAIWTDKGLIYVAKMNDKGELELI